MPSNSPAAQRFRKCYENNKAYREHHRVTMRDGYYNRKFRDFICTIDWSAPGHPFTVVGSPVRRIGRPSKKNSSNTPGLKTLI